MRNQVAQGRGGEPPLRGWGGLAFFTFLPDSHSA